MTIIERTIAIAKRGHLGRMSQVQANVWHVLNAHAHESTQEAYPSTETIAGLIGHADTKSVRLALRWLVDNGFLEVVAPATFRLPAVYRVLVPPGDAPARPSAAPSGRTLRPREGYTPSLRQQSREGCAPQPERAARPNQRGLGAPPKSPLKSEVKSAPTHRAGAWDRFAEAFPAHKRIGLPAARTLWIAEELDDDADAILAGLERWKRSDAWQREQGRYVPRPLAFLADRQWLADPSPQTARPAAATPSRRRCW